MTNPNEPTLTCSEVVERLTYEALCTNWPTGIAEFRSEATKILDSWRERRVQELENMLAKHSGCSHCKDSASGGIDKWSSSEIRKDKEK